MFNIQSPDWFDISMELFKTAEEAWAYFEVWKARFQNQGYYSTRKWEQIPLEEIKDRCTLVDYS